MLTKKIFVGGIPIGGGSPISVQSMTFTKTADIESTIEQIRKLYFAGCDIVRLAVTNEEDVLALKSIKSNSPIPIVADIHFNHRLAIKSSEFVDCIRINPGNIGSKEKIKDVVKACSERKIPIRIGVNCGSLEEQFEQKFGQTSQGMIESALYNIKLLEDFGFLDIKVSLKASDVLRTVEAYRKLRGLVEYPFHLGVTEAGTLFGSTIKSSIAIGLLLLEGIGDTIRVSITGELEKEIEVGKAILKYIGLNKEGVNIISCPTCGRLEANLLEAIKVIEEKTKNIKKNLTISIMGCSVNSIGEAKGADLAIAFGNKNGLIIKKGEVIDKLPQELLIDRFLEEVENYE